MAYDYKAYFKELHKYLDYREKFDAVINEEIGRRAALPENKGRSIDSIEDEIVQEVQDNVKEIITGLTDREMRIARNKLDEYREEEDEYEDDVIEFDSFDDLLQHVNEEHEWYTHEDDVKEQIWLKELCNSYGCDPDDVVVAYWMHKDEDHISLDTMIDTINSFYETEEE